MKKIAFLLLMTAFSFAVFAQETEKSPDAKYLRAMQTYIPAVDTTRTQAGFVALSAAFERIAEAEKEKWQPYYYAALSQVNAAYFMGMENIKAETTDPMADKAEALLSKADRLSPNNSEIYVVKKMIATLRMMGDPMNRYMQYGPMAEEALQTAMKLNPDNPRVYLLQGQDKFYTPEQYGGSKTQAKELFELAQKKYTLFRPANTIDPTWGQPATTYFLSQINK